MTVAGNNSLRLVYFIIKDFFVVYKYVTFPCAILAVMSIIVFLVIRCTIERSVHTGDTLTHALCVLDLILSVCSVPTLIKLFFVHDDIEYLDHVSCVMLVGYHVAHDFVFLLKTILLTLMAFKRFNLVSFPLVAKKLF